MMSYILPTPKFIEESIATQRKLCVQHSSRATQAIRAFMMSKTSCSSVLLQLLGITLRTVSYKRTQKLRSLLTSIRAAFYESLPGKCLALLKLDVLDLV